MRQSEKRSRDMERARDREKVRVVCSVSDPCYMRLTTTLGTC